MRALYVGAEIPHFQPVKDGLEIIHGEAEVFLASSMEELEKLLSGDPLDIALCESQPFGVEEFTVIRAIRSTAPELPILLFTENVERCARAIELGASYCLPPNIANFQRLADLIPPLLAAHGEIGSSTGNTSQAWLKDETKYHHLFESMPVGLYRSTIEGVILDVNPALVELLGYSSKNEVMKLKASQFFVYPEDRTHQNLLLQSVDHPQTFEMQMRRRDGSIIWVRDISCTIRDDTGNILYIEGSIEDITANKLAEERIRTVQTRLQFLLSSSPTILFTCEPNPPYNPIFISENMLDMVGYRADTFKQEPDFWMNQIHPDDVVIIEEKLEKLQEKGKLSFEYRFRHRDGYYRWLHDEWRLVYNAANTAIEIIGTTTDITERRQVADTLAHREAILEAVSFAAEQFLQDVDLGQSIQLVLEQLGQATDSSRVYLLENETAEDGYILTSQTHEWKKEETGSKQTDHVLAGFPFKASGNNWIMVSLEEGKLVCGNLQDFPQGGNKGFIPLEAVSVALVPIFISGKWCNTLGFEDHKEKRTWAAAERDALKAAASIFGAAFQRKRTEAAQRESERKFRSVFEFAGIGIATIDLKGNLKQTNPALQKMLGYSEAELSKMSLADITHPDDLAEEMARLERPRLEPSPKPYRREKRFLDKDGRTVWGNLTASIIFDADGAPYFGVGMVEEITGRKNAEKELRDTRNQLAIRIFELEKRADEINTLSALSNMLQLCSQPDEAFGWVSHYCSDLFPNLSGSLFMVNETNNHLELKMSWGDPLINNGDIFNHDCWGLRRGRLYKVDSSANDLVCKHVIEPYPPSYLCVPIIIQSKSIGIFHLQSKPEMLLIDESQQQLAATIAEQIGLSLHNIYLKLELKEMAIRDPLTGLYNRHYLQDNLERELSRAARRNKPVSLMLLDFDAFREFNARLGHSAGDMLLRDIGTSILGSIRAEDVACRFGGDEFLLILSEMDLVTARQRAAELAERIALIGVNDDKGMPQPMTAAIAIACFPQHGRNGTDLLKAVNLTVEKAKQQGGNCIVIAGATD